MIKKIVLAYHNLSYQKKMWIGKCLFPVKLLIKSINELCFDVYRFSGDPNIAYITSIDPDPSFIEYFYPGAVLEKTGRIYAWSLRRFARRFDRTIICMPRYLGFFFNDGIITVPWVRQVLDLNIPVTETKNYKNRKNRLSAYEFEISKDPAVLKFFYEKMYLPYVSTRHDNPLIQDFSKFDYFLRKNGELLLVKKNGQPVGGAFCKIVGDTYHGTNTGLIDDRFLREDAMSAIYYFEILRAKERNARYLDFGESRPFLFDGILKHKKRWSARVAPNAENNYIYYLKNLVREDLIILEDHQFKAISFSENDPSSSKYATAGVGIKVISPMS